MEMPNTFKEWFNSLPEKAKEQYRNMRKVQMKQKRDKTRKRKFTSRSKRKLS
jgi:hypothetical protein